MSNVRLSSRESRVLVTLGRLVGDNLTWRDLVRVQGRHIRLPKAKGQRMEIDLPFPRTLADTGGVKRCIQCGTDQQEAMQALLWHERNEAFLESNRLLFHGMTEGALRMAFSRLRRASEDA